MIVVADTSPINYLLLTDCIDLLPHFYRQVAMPTAVRDELLDSGAPLKVQTWMEHSASWLLIRTADVS